MQSRTKAPEFHQQDWSQFDFSRWHLDGITLDAAAAALAGAAERLFNSADWRDHFKSALPAVRRETLGVFKEHSRKLREQQKLVSEDFERRIVVAAERTSEFRKFVDAAAAPPVVESSPKTFHAAVKVTGKDASLGLPDLVVRILHPKDQSLALAQAVTDESGNAILTVPEEVAREVDKTDTALEVLSPEGKSLLTMPGAICVRVDQVETKVLAVKESAEIAPLKKAALAVRAERDIRLRSLDVRVQTLKQNREERLHDLDSRLEDNEAIIRDIESDEDAVEFSNVVPAQEAPGPSKPSKPERSTPSRKGRKKTKR